MSNIPQFTAEENLTRVIMDKNSQYLIVEGSFDLPIYCEAISLLMDKHQLSNEPIIVFGGGKLNILVWTNNENPSNAVVILDMDFDNPDVELKNNIITPLRRYSIENYFFDEEVAAPFIAHLLNRNINDVKAVLSFKDLHEHWGAELKELIPVIYYYQKIYLGDKEKWSSIFINQNSGDWHLCPQRIIDIKVQLLAEMDISYEICKSQFQLSIGATWNAKINFPGKILFESFYRYLKKMCNDEKCGVYGGSVSNTKSLITHLAPRLVKNTELENILLRAIN